MTVIGLPVICLIFEFIKLGSKYQYKYDYRDIIFHLTNCLAKENILFTIFYMIGLVWALYTGYEAKFTKIMKKNNN